MKKEEQKQKALIVAVGWVIVVGLLLFCGLQFADIVKADDYCAGGSCPVDAGANLISAVPNITFVYPLTVTLSGNSTVHCSVVFNATDDNGYTDINLSSAMAYVGKTGETTRNNTPEACEELEHTTKVRKINCTLTFKYWDSAGADWDINVTISDNSGNSTYNDTVNAEVNALSYVMKDLVAVNWTISSETNDQEADSSLIISDRGNQDYTTATVTDSNMTFSTNTIYDTNMSVDTTTGSTTGQTYLSASGETYSDFALTHGEDANEEIFWYMDTSILPVGMYVSDNAWSVDPA